MKQLIYKIILCLMISTSSLKAGWDMEYWQKLFWINYDSPCFTATTIGEIRFNHGCKRASFYRLSEWLSYKPLNWLSLDFTYTYIWDKPWDAPHFLWRQRYEIDINPKLDLDNGLTILWRNKMMFVKEQDVPKIRYVFRHRVTLIYPFEDRGHLKSVQCSDEVFYHFVNNRFSQNRFVPIQLNFAANDDLTIGVYLMIRNFESSLQWHRSLVLGSDFTF